MSGKHLVRREFSPMKTFVQYKKFKNKTKHTLFPEEIKEQVIAEINKNIAVSQYSCFVVELVFQMSKLFTNIKAKFKQY